MNTSYELSVFKGIEGFQKIRSDWQALYDRIGQPQIFQSPQWYESYLTALAVVPDEFYIVGVYEQGRIRAVIPVNRHQYNIAGLKFISLEVPDHPNITYRDILADQQSPPIDLYALLYENPDMQRLLPWDMLQIKRVYKTSSAMGLLAAAPAARCFKKRVNLCCMLPLGPFDTMMGKLSKKGRKKWRNKRNQLQKQPGFRYQTARSASELKEAYQLFLDVESSGWKGNEGSAIKLNKRPNEYYKKLLALFSASGACEINLLWIEGKPVAAEFVLIGAHDAYTLKTGFNESYKNLSPGHFLLEYMMQRYHEHFDHLKRINLLTGRSNYNYLRPEKEDVYDIYCFRKCIKGDLFSAFIRLRYLLKELFIMEIMPFLLSFPLFYKIMDRFNLLSSPVFKRIIEKRNEYQALEK